MKHEIIAGPLADAVTIDRGSGAQIDAAAAVAEGTHAFLRARWFSSSGRQIETVAAKRTDGSILGAIPLARRNFGPLRLSEVAGPYWPFRSFPLAAGVSDSELIAMLSHPEACRLLGRAWRFGPVIAGDPCADRLARLAPYAGWNVLRRELGAIFELDLAALRGEGEWPRGSTLRKNRWRERRLEEFGAIGYSSFTGADWTQDQRDALATVEQASWLAGLLGDQDYKFADPACRAAWEHVAGDTVLAPMLFGSLMTVGGEPAAFTFGLEVGATRYYIANNYNEKFGKFGPGKILLYRDFVACADRGVTRISWGAGDAGYKSEMGAVPGPAIGDLLFLRGSGLTALLRLFAGRAGWRVVGPS